MLFHFLFHIRIALFNHFIDTIEQTLEIMDDTYLYQIHIQDDIDTQ